MSRVLTKIRVHALLFNQPLGHVLESSECGFVGLQVEMFFVYLYDIILFPNSEEERLQYFAEF